MQLEMMSLHKKKENIPTIYEKMGGYYSEEILRELLKGGSIPNEEFLFWHKNVKKIPRSYEIKDVELYLRINICQMEIKDLYLESKKMLSNFSYIKLVRDLYRQRTEEIGAYTELMMYFEKKCTDCYLFLWLFGNEHFMQILEEKMIIMEKDFEVYTLCLDLINKVERKEILDYDVKEIELLRSKDNGSFFFTVMFYYTKNYKWNLKQDDNKYFILINLNHIFIQKEIWLECLKDKTGFADKILYNHILLLTENRTATLLEILDVSQFEIEYQKKIFIWSFKIITRNTRDISFVRDYYEKMPIEFKDIILENDDVSKRLIEYMYQETEEEIQKSVKRKRENGDDKIIALKKECVQCESCSKIFESKQMYETLCCRKSICRTCSLKKMLYYCFFCKRHCSLSNTFEIDIEKMISVLDEKN